MDGILETLEWCYQRMSVTACIIATDLHDDEVAPVLERMSYTLCNGVTISFHEVCLAPANIAAVRERLLQNPCVNLVITDSMDVYSALQADLDATTNEGIEVFLAPNQ